jgi:hypothetical protein
MISKKFLIAAMLIGSMGVLGGCHYGHDDHRDYSGYNRSGSRTVYREGFRDGRAYERRNEDLRDRRYSSDWWRRRW